MQGSAYLSAMAYQDDWRPGVVRSRTMDTGTHQGADRQDRWLACKAGSNTGRDLLKQLRAASLPDLSAAYVLVAVRGGGAHCKGARGTTPGRVSSFQVDLFVRA